MSVADLDKWKEKANQQTRTQNNKSKDGMHQDILSELTRPPEGAKGLLESKNQKVNDPVNHLISADRSVEWIRTYTTTDDDYHSQGKEPKEAEPQLRATSTLEPQLRPIRTLKP